MRVGFGLSAVVPVGVVRDVVVIIVVLCSSSVLSLVCSSLWLDYWGLFALVVKSWSGVRFRLKGGWLVWGVRSWLRFWLDRLFPAPAVSTVVGSSLLWFSLSWLNLFKCWSRYLG